MVKIIVSLMVVVLHMVIQRRCSYPPANTKAHHVNSSIHQYQQLLQLILQLALFLNTNTQSTQTYSVIVSSPDSVHQFSWRTCIICQMYIYAEPRVCRRNDIPFFLLLIHNFYRALFQQTQLMSLEERILITRLWKILLLGG